MVLRIPYDEIEVTDGWRVVDLATLEDCDGAMLHLARDVASIEAQLDEFGRDSDLGAEVSDDDADWQRKARAALRIKREIRQVVQNRRGDIGKAAKRDAAEAHDRRLLSLLQAMAPDVFAAAVAQIKEPSKDWTPLVPAERLTALQEEVERLTDLTTAMGLATREQRKAAETEVERLRGVLNDALDLSEGQHSPHETIRLIRKVVREALRTKDTPKP